MQVWRHLILKKQKKIQRVPSQEVMLYKPCILFIYIVLNGMFILSFVENTFNESLGNIGAILI